MNKKITYCTQEQKSALIELMNRNPLLVRGKFSQDFGFKDAQQKWMDIAKLLNEIPGSRKHWKQWRKTWQDIRAKAKARKTALVQQLFPATPAQGRPEGHDRPESVYVAEVAVKEEELASVEERPNRTRSARRARLKDGRTSPHRKTELSAIKVQLKKSYYDKKVSLMERRNEILERQAELMERGVLAVESIAISLQK